MTDTWESSALVQEVWESSGSPAVTFTSVHREPADVSLSNATPQALGTAGAGVASSASRADHVHAMPNAAAVGADASGSASSAVTAHNSSGTAHSDIRTLIEGKPVIFADWGLHHYDTDGAEPTAELNPANDLTAWETGGGREFWNVPTTGTTRLLIHDETDRTLSGVWVYDADAHTIVRAPDADTTAKLHGKHVIAIEYRDRASGAVAVNPAWRPINTTLVARDATDPIGTAVWDCVETIDTETFNTVTSFLQATITAKPGYRSVANMVYATAVDGTATDLDVLYPLDTAGEQSIPDADDFSAVLTLPVATVVAAFGEAMVLVPYGPDLGVYQLKASGAWTPFGTVGGEVLMVLGGTATGQPAFWQGVNDNGSGSVTPAAAPTGWLPFSVTPSQAYFRRLASLTRYTPDDNADWSGSPPSTVAAALDRIAAAIGPIG